MTTSNALRLVPDFQPSINKQHRLLKVVKKKQVGGSVEGGCEEPRNPATNLPKMQTKEGEDILQGPDLHLHAPGQRASSLDSEDAQLLAEDFNTAVFSASEDSYPASRSQAGRRPPSRAQ